MDFAKKLNKEQIHVFIKQLFGNNLKAVYIEPSKDEETIIHGKVKLSDVKGSVPISFDNYHFRISFIKIDDFYYTKFGATTKQKNIYVNRKFRIFMYETFGEKYYKALEEYLKKDSKIEQTIANESIKLVEEKYKFLTSEIQGKISKLEKELKEAEIKKQKEINEISENFEQEISTNTSILEELKSKFSDRIKN